MYDDYSTRLESDPEKFVVRPGNKVIEVFDENVVCSLAPDVKINLQFLPACSDQIYYNPEIRRTDPHLAHYSGS